MNDNIIAVLTKALHEAETSGGWWGHPECEEFARIISPAVQVLMSNAAADVEVVRTYAETKAHYAWIRAFETSYQRGYMSAYAAGIMLKANPYRDRAYELRSMNEHPDEL